MSATNNFGSSDTTRPVVGPLTPPATRGGCQGGQRQLVRTNRGGISRAIGEAGPGFTHPVEPFDRGDSFPTEPTRPLNDGPGPEGQRGALQVLVLGDDPLWFDTRPPRALIYTEAVLPRSGPLALAEGEHFRQFRRPLAPRGGWLRRLFGRLTR